MVDEFQTNINAASKIIEMHTYPLLIVDENEFPDVIATCVFIEKDGLFYLITAAHAIRGIETGLMTRGKNSLIDISGSTTISCSTGKDHFDIAAIKIEKTLIQEEEIKYIPESMFITSVKVTNPVSRATSGFLNSMNKQTKILNKIEKVFTGKCYTYFGATNDIIDYSLFNKSQETHIGMEFKPGTNDSGKYLSTPPWPPKGFSGGGMWLVPNISRPEMVFLEGVFIEGHKRSRKMYGFSTKLEHILYFINKTHNKALKSDPKSYAPFVALRYNATKAT